MAAISSRIPRGTLIWDTGAVPDGMVKPGGAPVRYRIALPDAQERFVTLTKSLKTQLADAGYRPADITHVVLSHYHYDHSANTNDFASATWLVRQVERDAMFAAKPPDLVLPSTYSALRGSKTTIIKTDDYDVFGDGTVVIKFTPGHTPGHQVLSLKLANTGRVVLSGDLYHYPEERTLGRIPTFDDNQEQTAKTRARARRVPQEEQRPTLDSARLHGQREIEEGAASTTIDGCRPARTDRTNVRRGEDLGRSRIEGHRLGACRFGHYLQQDVPEQVLADVLVLS